MSTTDEAGAATPKIKLEVLLTFLVTEHDEAIALAGSEHGIMAFDYMIDDEDGFANVFDQLRMMAPDSKLDSGVYRWDGYAHFTLWDESAEFDYSDICDLEIEGTVTLLNRDEALAAFDIWLTNANASWREKQTATTAPHTGGGSE